MLWAGLRIGLLGGSFNPAHEGHRFISTVALHALGLDEVWWLVSPQNPLKPAAGMAGFAERRASAEAMARHPRMRVVDLEVRLGTRYTAETLTVLRRRFPRTRFVWLMGADNLIQIPRWHAWQDIFRTVPVAVFRRRPYSLSATRGRAGHCFAAAQLPWRRRASLAQVPPPVWLLCENALHAASATAIRSHTAPLARRMELADRDHGPATRGTRDGLPGVAEVRDLIERSLSADQADEMVVFDVAGRTSIADVIVIASGRSGRHVGAMADKLAQRLKAAGVRDTAIEGMPQCDWVLIDAGDVIVHLFRPEVRRFYNLEKLWGGETPTAEHAALPMV